jgi:hypothetical protein
MPRQLRIQHSGTGPTATRIAGEISDRVRISAILSPGHAACLATGCECGVRAAAAAATAAAHKS